MTAEQKLDMSLIKESPHYTETVDPQVDALRKYQLLSAFKENGRIKPNRNKSQLKLIEEFSSLSSEEQDAELLKLQSVYSTV